MPVGIVRTGGTLRTSRGFEERKRPDGTALIIYIKN
jgi:hypothetical protein